MTMRMYRSEKKEPGMDGKSCPVGTGRGEHILKMTAAKFKTPKQVNDAFKEETALSFEREYFFGSPEKFHHNQVKFRNTE